VELIEAVLLLLLEGGQHRESVVNVFRQLEPWTLREQIGILERVLEQASTRIPLPLPPNHPHDRTDRVFLLQIFLSLLQEPLPAWRWRMSWA
jgi:hypothetical protein